MHSVQAAKHYGLFGGFVGLICGVLYAGIGFVIDLTTIGLNLGTALAFLAILGMPLLFATGGAAAGLLWAPVERRIPPRFGGST